ncbi:MAG: SAM-dependent methyltransferase [Rhizobiaceae bacterium]
MGLLSDESPSRADPYADPTSLEFRFRARRFEAVGGLIEAILTEKGWCEVLDLGGTETYWKVGAEFLERHRAKIRITILNTEEQRIRDRRLFGFARESATATNLLGARRFDLVHSNSVIEHVGSLADMARFAENTRRLAPRYYVQTPNYWFAYEPHFRAPFFQYLPEAMRAALIMRYALGFFPRIDDRAEAESIIYHHRLLSTRQMRVLFPDAALRHEKFLGLNKSIVAIRSTPAATG